MFWISALDFGVYSRVTGRLVLAIGVDGWQHHGNRATSLARRAQRLDHGRVRRSVVLRLPTNGSGENASSAGTRQAALIGGRHPVIGWCPVGGMCLTAVFVALWFPAIRTFVRSEGGVIVTWRCTFVPLGGENVPWCLLHILGVSYGFYA